MASRTASGKGVGPGIMSCSGVFMGIPFISRFGLAIRVVIPFYLERPPSPGLIWSGQIWINLADVFKRKATDLPILKQGRPSRYDSRRYDPSRHAIARPDDLFAGRYVVEAPG